MHDCNTIEDWLSQYHDLGLSFFNTGSREKKIAIPWTAYQTMRPNDGDIQAFLKKPSQNYAIVCGEISNLVVIDVDIRNGGEPTPFLDRGFYTVKTPSGGYHFYFKYDKLLKSTKHKKTKTEGDFLKGIDVQSNGSLVFAPPTHFDGKMAYEVFNDAEVTPMPDDLLLQVLDALEPEKEGAKDAKPYKAPIVPENGRPGDIFNALARWEDVLIPLGWTKVGVARPGGTQYWRRPGKPANEGGVSASTNYKGYDLFFVYTTHFPELTPMKGYTRFSLYAAIHHNSDYRKAAVALVMENYNLVYKPQYGN